MDIKFELIISCKLLISLFLGAIIGLDRERHGGNAGIRTYAAVCMGAALFTSIAIHIENDISAGSRVIANIITGVGFIGAGIIYRDHKANSSHGLTTAATVWCTAGVGVAIGSNMFVIAVAGTLALYFLLSLHHQKWYVKWKRKIYADYKNKSDDE